MMVATATTDMGQDSFPKRIRARGEKSFSKPSPMPCTVAESKRISRALWTAFPSNSEAELCEKAAEYFLKPNGDHISPRTVKYWLRGDTLPSYMHTLALIRMVGVEYFFPSHDAFGCQ